MSTLAPAIPTPVKIIIADAYPIYRYGLVSVLSMEEDLLAIKQCQDNDHLLQRAQTAPGGIAIFSSAIVPGKDARTVMAHLVANDVKGMVILEPGERISPYTQAGVHGLLPRAVRHQALVDCVRRVLRGERVMHAWLDNRVVAAAAGDPTGERVRDSLTAKEMKIVAFIAQGCKNKEIALRLGTTEQMIKNSLRGVYDKTGVSDRLELALFTIHHEALAKAAAACTPASPQEPGSYAFIA